MSTPLQILASTPPPRPQFKDARAAHVRIQELETLLGVEHGPMLVNVMQFNNRIVQLESLLAAKELVKTESAPILAVEPPKPAPISEAVNTIPAHLRGVARAVFAHEQKTRRAATLSEIPHSKTAANPSSQKLDWGDLCLAVYGKGATAAIISNAKNPAELEAKIRKRFFVDNLTVPGVSFSEFSESDRLPRPSGLERITNARKQNLIFEFINKSKL